MTTKEQGLESQRQELEDKEVGVGYLMEFYSRVEAIYVQASASLSESDVVYTSDSTNLVRAYADLGRDSS